MAGFLTIAGRELRVTSQRKVTYYRRSVVALITALVLGTFGILNSSRGGGVSAGSLLFALFSLLLGFYTALLGIRHSMDTLSTERREGTLGLLFLTPLSYLDVMA